MNSLFIRDFRYGLDTRRGELTQRAGSLEVLHNAYVNQGGEVENRKAFVRTARVVGTFGLQSTSSGLVTFGSADLAASHPVNIGTLGIPINVDYVRCQHPSVLDGMSTSVPSMTKVKFSTSFGGLSFVVAEFSDGNTFAYYNGNVVEDLTRGRVLPYLVGRNDRIAAHLLRIVNETAMYTAAYATAAISSCVNNGSGLIRVTLASTSDYATGDRITIAGVVGTTEANGSWVVTRISNSQLDLQSSSFVNAYVSGGTITWGHALNIDGQAGVDFTLETTLTTSAGTITGPTNTVTAVQAVAGASAVGSFVITGGEDNGVAATASTGTVVSTATNAVAGEYVKIGKKKYTFQTTLTVEGDVKIGVNAAASLVNLQRAILHTGTPGIDYLCAWRHPWVSAATIAGLTMTITLFKGKNGGTTAISTTSVTWTVTAFSASAGNCVAAVRVVNTAGVETELLSTAIRFTTNVSTTAALVKDEINSFTGTSGYSATVNENTITIYSSASASPMPNGYAVRVVSGGSVLIGECLFYFTQTATSFTINTIQVDGIDLLGGAKAFPVGVIDTLPEYYIDMVTSINARSGITGINAWTNGSYIKLSQISTRSDDQPVSVYVTPAVANTVGIVFDTPPPLAQPVSIVLPNEVVGVGNTGVSPVTGSGQSISATPPSINVDVQFLSLTGGNGLFTYSWYAEYPGTENVQLALYEEFTQFGNPVRARLPDIAAVISIVTPTARRTTITLTPPVLGPGSGISAGTSIVSPQINIDPITINYVVRCRVTDSFGNSAVSNPCTVVFQYT